MDRIEKQINTLDQRLNNPIRAIEAAKAEAVAEIRALTSREDDPVVYENGSLTSGYDMGVSTSEGRTDWVSKNDDAICMAYPDGQEDEDLIRRYVKYQEKEEKKRERDSRDYDLFS